MFEILQERRTNMAKRIMTLDNLYKFFVEQNKSFNFSSKESGTPIVVTSNGHFAESKSDDMPGMLKLKLKNCHIDTNRNGSHISKENMEKAMPTLKYRPILAYIHELPDGTKDFYAHNVQFEEDENGDTQVVYLEKQVGCFTADEPWLEYDEDMDKTYVMAYAVIPEEYTETADIIRRKNGTKVSTELVINELSYNAKEKYLDLIDFYFGGTTLLGSDEDGNEIGEGMLGARGDITDFCHKEPKFTYQDKLIETLDKLNVTLSSFNKTNSEEGGDEEMDNFENEVVEEVVETEVEETVVENNEVEETVVESNDVEETEVVEETETEDTSTSEDGDEDDVEEVAIENEADPVVEEPAEKFEIKFELSHDDIRTALYQLLNAYSEDGYSYAWIIEVYDSKFVYEDWTDDGYKFFRQAYSRDGDNVAFDGDRIEVFNEWLSKAEKDALDELKSNYAELKMFKDNYDASQLKAEKMAVLDSAEYSEIKESDEFKALISEIDNYSVEEIKVKADLLFAASMKKKFNFEVETEKKPHTVGINFNAKPNKKMQAYAGLFSE
jgi:hypothetical protein